MAEQTITPFGWNDTVQTADDNGGEFALLTPGYATFKVSGFERAYYEGGPKLPACNQAKLTLEVTDSRGVTSTVYDNLNLLSNWMWKITSFFKACRLIDESVPANSAVTLPWDRLTGATGFCKVDRRTYTKDGAERQTNDVKSYVHTPEGLRKAAGALGYQLPSQPAQAQPAPAPAPAVQPQVYQQPQAASQPAWGQPLSQPWTH